jgi:Mn2+/Fe2+ NRAMP family transporter
MLVLIPLMAAVQFMSAKVGLVTGRGLAGVLRQNYPRWQLYPVAIGLVAASTMNAGADLGAIAAACKLLAPGISVTALIIPVGVVILALQSGGATSSSSGLSSGCAWRSWAI